MEHNTTLKGNVTIHVRQDSDTDLEQLFQSVLSPPRDGTNKPVPLRHRKLPPSFFKPPPNAAGSVGNMAMGGSPGSPMMAGKDPGAHIHHDRAHSSPASLGQMVQQTQLAQHQGGNNNQNNFMVGQHARAQSQDALETESLPPGWETRINNATGQKMYFK